MWVEYGFQPDAFWHQTPLHFQLALDAVRDRVKFEREESLFLAYNTAALSSAASAGKLKPFDHYRKRLSPKKLAQTPSEMLEVFREFQARGAPMTIRRVERTSDGNAA
jgi:hypothetical protein